MPWGTRIVKWESKHTVYLNPGSLGCNHKPRAPYAIVTVKNNNVEVNLKESFYDNTAFLKSYHTLQVPESEFILKVLMEINYRR